jgi:hypothetical protein
MMPTFAGCTVAVPTGFRYECAKCGRDGQAVFGRRSAAIDALWAHDDRVHRAIGEVAA